MLVSDFLVLFSVGTGVLLKTFKTDKIGRPQSINVSFRFFSFVPSGYWCFAQNVKDWEMK